MDTIRDARTDLPIFIHSILDDFGLTPNAFRVYAHLVRRLGRNEYAWPSYNDIGRWCFSEIYRRQGKKPNPATLRRMAIRAVEELLDKHLIRKESQRAENGGHKSNHYTLTPQSEWASAIAPGGDVRAPAPGDAGSSDSAMAPSSDLGSPKGTQLEGTQLEGAQVGDSAASQSSTPAAEKVVVPRSPSTKRQRDLNLDHPTVQAYRDKCRLTPNEAQRSEIAAAVTDVARWEAVMSKWLLSGYRPQNVAGMLDWYRSGIPGEGRINGRTGVGGGFGIQALKTSERNESKQPSGDKLARATDEFYASPTGTELADRR